MAIAQVWRYSWFYTVALTPLLSLFIQTIEPTCPKFSWDISSFLSHKIVYCHADALKWVSNLVYIVCVYVWFIEAKRHLQTAPISTSHTRFSWPGQFSVTVHRGHGRDFTLEQSLLSFCIIDSQQHRPVPLSPRTGGHSTKPITSGAKVASIIHVPCTPSHRHGTCTCDNWAWDDSMTCVFCTRPAKKLEDHSHQHNEHLIYK